MQIENKLINTFSSRLAGTPCSAGLLFTGLGMVVEVGLLNTGLEQFSLTRCRARSMRGFTTNRFRALSAIKTKNIHLNLVTRELWIADSADNS